VNKQFLKWDEQFSNSFLRLLRRFSTTITLFLFVSRHLNIKYVWLEKSETDQFFKSQFFFPKNIKILDHWPFVFFYFKKIKIELKYELLQKDSKTKIHKYKVKTSINMHKILKIKNITNCICSKTKLQNHTKIGTNIRGKNQQNSFN